MGIEFLLVGALVKAFASMVAVAVVMVAIAFYCW